MTIELFPLNSSATIKHNTGQVELIELAIRKGEGQFAACGALAVETGAHTGRSAQDKYVVRDAATEKAVWWDNNKSMTPEQFDLLLSDFREHAKSRELFVQDLFAGADPAQRLNARIFVEYRLARAVHSPSAAPAGGRASWPGSSRSSPSSTCRASAPTPSATACAPRR